MGSCLCLCLVILLFVITMQPQTSHHPRWQRHPGIHTWQCPAVTPALTRLDLVATIQYCTSAGATNDWSTGAPIRPPPPTSWSPYRRVHRWDGDNIEDEDGLAIHLSTYPKGSWASFAIWRKILQPHDYWPRRRHQIHSGNAYSLPLP